MEIVYFIIFFFFAFVGIGINIIIHSSKHTVHNTHQKYYWTAFAEKYSLDFTPAKTILGAQNTIKGIYRGHKMIMAEKRLNGNEFNEINTHIIIYVNPLENDKSIQASQITDDIETLLDPDKFVRDNYRNLTFKSLTIESYVQYKKFGIITKLEELEEIANQLVSISKHYARAIALKNHIMQDLISLTQHQFHPLKNFAEAVLNAILAKNSDWSANYLNLLCTHCLTRCIKHKVSLSWTKSFEFYGCRVCKQMDDFYDAPIVSALLDTTEPLEMYQQNEILYINWQKTPKFFDFNQINILYATDEEVERFVVTIANQADITNSNIYRSLPCFVSTTCQLNHNTINVLDEIFGEVIIQEG